ncbi:MAG TPA: alanine racemase [Herpetosiphonaceae bacterium]
MVRLEDLLASGAVLAQRGACAAWPAIAYDSRLARPGDLFVAVQTERADGHAFIGDALAAGASGVLCVAPPANLPDAATVLTAPDVVAALGQWASSRLRQVAPTTIAVTGSVGKTSTKRAIASLLAGEGPTFRSPRSFNSRLGLPVALAGLKDDCRWAVLEFGADRPGDIAGLAGLFPPQIAVVTAVGPAHLNHLGSIDGVAREKGALVQTLPADGWAVLNGDDPRVLAMARSSKAWVITYGTGAHCDLWASDIRVSPAGTEWVLHGHSEGEPPPGAKRIRRDIWAMPTRSKTLGIGGVRATLAALATALACHVPLERALERLERLEAAAGRLRPLPSAQGALLLDDSFNAAPPSMLLALHTLRDLPARRRIAVLGDMSDLGEASGAYHEQIGAEAAAIADVLITKGDRATRIAQAARDRAAELGRPLEVMPVYTAAAALQALPADLGAGDVVLVKGSAEARMERVAAGLLAPDLAAGAVLVRQEQVWHQVRIGTPDRPTTLRIDLDALAHNARRLREIAGVPLLAVLKADAYGHGAIRAARTVLLNGAHGLAVATLGEALALRGADIAAPILILGYTPPWQSQDAVRQNITCTVFDAQTLQALNSVAGELGRVCAVHVKVDTGMARLGLAPEETPAFLRLAADLPHIRVEGIFTHFATADAEDPGYLRQQAARWDGLLAELASAGLRPPQAHAANSAALLHHGATRYDLARAGIALYGLQPSPHAPLPADFQPVMSFHTEVAQVREVPAGTAVSYGCTFVTERPSRIATLPVGYADGFRRAPQPWREVLIGGRRAPIVGRVCMDYAMADVTDGPPVRRGDPVVLIGQQGGERISAEDVADWLGTINYEVVSAILPRVPRESDEEG